MDVTKIKFRINLIYENNWFYGHKNNGEIFVFRGGIWEGGLKNVIWRVTLSFALLTKYQTIVVMKPKRGETECTREMYAEDKKICHFD